MLLIFIFAILMLRSNALKGSHCLLQAPSVIIDDVFHILIMYKCPLRESFLSWEPALKRALYTFSVAKLRIVNRN